MFVVLIFMGIRGILWDFRVEEEAEREIFIDGSFKHFSSDSLLIPSWLIEVEDVSHIIE